MSQGSVAVQEKAQGFALGRPKGPSKSKLDPFRPEIESLLANGSTRIKDLMREFGCRRPAVYRLLDENAD